MRGSDAQLFSTRVTIVIALALVIPFGIMQLTSAEPFPAILLPAGATEVRTNDSVVEYGGVVLEGVDDQGAPVAIDAAEFLDPIPVQYLYALADAHFALDAGDDVDGGATSTPDEPAIVVRKVGWSLDLPSFEPSEAEQREIREWLRGRLVAAGLSPEWLVVRRVWIEADSETGDEIDRTTEDAVSIDL